MGHRVVYCSGNDDVPGNYIIPELYAQHPQTWKILQNTSVELKDYGSEESLELDIYNHADVLEEKLLQAIHELGIDLLVPNNLCSGGYQPAAAIAFHRVIRKTGLPAIIHSHDFYFEDSDEVNATCHTAESIYHRYFPPKLPKIQHVFINKIAQKELKRRKNIDGIVVPNVFDFGQESWVPDSYNHDFRESFGIAAKDIVFLQATRILDRKGVEMAIDTLARIQQPTYRNRLNGISTRAGGVVDSDSRVVLLCAGIVETIGISGAYWQNIQNHARNLGVELVHAGNRVRHSRGADNTAGTVTEKIYSLWDSYVSADFVTYPSYWEGWGNQFVEAVFAKLPILVFEYPVWTSDLAEKNFQVVSLGSKIAGTRENGLVYAPDQDYDRAAEEIVQILINPARQKNMGEHNFMVAKTSFSMENLEVYITGLLKRADIEQQYEL